MSQPTTEPTTAAGNGRDGGQSNLRIDSEVFETLSLADGLRPDANLPPVVRWFETWSRAGR